jgi:hypothetical protein
MDLQIFQGDQSNQSKATTLIKAPGNFVHSEKKVC